MTYFVPMSYAFVAPFGIMLLDFIFSSATCTYLGSMYLLCGYTLAMAPKYKSKFRLAYHHVGKALEPINMMKWLIKYSRVTQLLCHARKQGQADVKVKIGSTINI